MNTLQTTERKDYQGTRRLKTCASMIAGLALSGAIALSPFAMAQQARDRCSASVQSGSMPNFHTKGRTDHLVNTPLMRQESSYLAVTLPGPYAARLTKAARGRPESERSAFVRDAVQRNIDLALTSIGTRQRVTFDCAPLTEPAVRESPSDAGAREQAPEPPPVAPADAGMPPQGDGGASRRRVIQPGK